MMILTHHSNEAWDVFLTLPSHHRTTARTCNFVLVNSPGWRYNSEHKKAKSNTWNIACIYLNWKKLNGKQTSTLSESYKYTRLPEFYQMVLQSKNWIERKREEGKNTAEQLPRPTGPPATFTWIWADSFFAVFELGHLKHLGVEV